MVQKGNPYQLPIRQHIFPTKSIGRFCGSSGGVEVYFKAKNLSKKLRPTDPPFVVNQYWDAKAEDSFKDIEDRYQAMIDNLNFDRVFSSKKLNHGIVSKMYASWYARAHFEKIDDQQIRGIIGPSPSLSEDEREQNEKYGGMTVGDNYKIYGRQMAWRDLHNEMERIDGKLHGRKWGVLSSSNGEFLVPDKPPRNLTALPISPRHIFILDYPSQTVPLVSVMQINGIFFQCAHSYCFAREIEKCPRDTL